MNHHDDSFAAIVKKLNYLGRQAQSGDAANIALLPST
jgi:hypothetical protein